MDLITIILVVGSLVNGVLLTLTMRYARGADERATAACSWARMGAEHAESSNHRLLVAIAALPKKRKPRAKVESDVTAS